MARGADYDGLPGPDGAACSPHHAGFRGGKAQSRPLKSVMTTAFVHLRIPAALRRGEGICDRSRTPSHPASADKFQGLKAEGPKRRRRFGSRKPGAGDLSPRGRHPHGFRLELFTYMMRPRSHDDVEVAERWKIAVRCDSAERFDSETFETFRLRGEPVALFDSSCVHPA